MPYAYKVRKAFSTSPLSGKRDYAILQYEKDGFYMFDDRGRIVPTNLDDKSLEETKAYTRKKELK